MVFIETPIFTAQIGKYLGDDDYSRLQSFLSNHPEAGKIIKGSGGNRRTNEEAQKGVDPVKKQLFEELLLSVKQAVAIERGEMPPSRVFVADPKNEVARVRAKLALSQDKFAALLGISPATLRNWEQGRRQPTGAAKVLLKLASRHPRLVLEAAA